MTLLSDASSGHLTAGCFCIPWSHIFPLSGERLVFEIKITHTNICSLEKWGQRRSVILHNDIMGVTRYWWDNELEVSWVGTKNFGSGSNISALDGGEWSASRPGRSIPSERAPCTPWIGGFVDRRAGVDDVKKRNFLAGCWNPVAQPVARRYNHWAIPAPCNLQLLYNN
jgi:hypothetical protein